MAFNSLIQISSKAFSTSSIKSSVIKNVTVIGGGLMGSGIAQVAAQTGHKVNLIDLSEDILNKAQKSIENNLGRIAKKKYADKPEEGQKFVQTALDNLSVGTSVEKVVGSSDLVIEAIIEKIEIKQKLFDSLDKIAPQHTILATNTSALPIGEIVKGIQRKDKSGGLHFFNPVPVMKLLEVVKISETSDETYNKLMEFGKNMGKVTITCKDTPGFVVNRLLVPYLLESVRLLERGDATARDIDTAMKLGAGHPMGPFELADYVGLDTTKFILDSWQARFPNHPLFEPIPYLDNLVAQKKFGIKSGEGFYKYEMKTK